MSDNALSLMTEPVGEFTRQYAAGGGGDDRFIVHKVIDFLKHLNFHLQILWYTLL